MSIVMSRKFIYPTHDVLYFVQLEQLCEKKYFFIAPDMEMNASLGLFKEHILIIKFGILRDFYDAKNNFTYRQGTNIS